MQYVFDIIQFSKIYGHITPGYRLVGYLGFKVIDRQGLGLDSILGFRVESYIYIYIHIYINVYTLYIYIYMYRYIDR